MLRLSHFQFPPARDGSTPSAGESREQMWSSHRCLPCASSKLGNGVTARIRKPPRPEQSALGKPGNQRLWGGDGNTVRRVHVASSPEAGVKSQLAYEPSTDGYHFFPGRF